MSRFGLRVVVPVLLTGAALAGCSSSSDEPTALPPGSGPAATAAAPTTAAPTSTAAPTPTATVGTQRSPIRWLGPAATGTQTVVQEATKSYWSMVVRLAEKPNPADPEITAFSVSPQRDTLLTLFTNIKQQGITQRGPIDGSATVVAVKGAKATASTCLDQTLVRVYDRAGKPRPGSSGSKQQFTVSLELEDGSWRVSQVSTGSACTLPG
ncbi:MAG TPA: hypothetical protein VGP36_24850 [Mycobacteriales bacterium]|jgi:hypothetical protein|nr:hypothetical protein [Mycobacteriales bacterium]